MAEEMDNHTLAPLREMREEMRDMKHEITQGFKDANERLAALEMKTDGQSGQLSMIIGLLANHTDRLELLEGRDR